MCGIRDGMGHCTVAWVACKLVCLLILGKLAFSDDLLGHCSTDSLCNEVDLVSLTLGEIGNHVYDKCMLLHLQPVEVETQSILSQLYTVFKNDSHILVGHLNVNVTDVYWNTQLRNSPPFAFAFYAREKRDRSCLLLPPKTDFLAEPYVGALGLEVLVQFLNEKCGAFRGPNGALTEEGSLHQHIMQNLYSPSNPVEKCTRLKSMPSKLDFFRDYAFRSRPVVIEKAVSSWPAMKKWTMEYLSEQYGEKLVHIKLTPDGVFEGVESATLWSGYRQDWIPDAVRSQLPYLDLVVVRPATSEMKFSDFLDFIASGNQSLSAYLEYSSIPYYMPKLQQDIFELPFIEGSLEVRQLNMWLSDGNTLGKLHFDPFDNLLCQVYSGSYNLLLFKAHMYTSLAHMHTIL